MIACHLVGTGRYSAEPSWCVDPTHRNPAASASKERDVMTFRERLAILGGADPIDPLEPNNGVRHAAVGGLLICVAAWAWAAAGGMLHSSLKAPWPVAIFGGLLIAAVIFFIDVLITCTPLKADKARYRARVILIRGMISLAMG